MGKAKKIFLISLYTILFSILIFIGKEILFGVGSSEEVFIETHINASSAQLTDNGYYSFSGVTQEQINTTVHELIYQSFHEKNTEEQQNKVGFHYVPGTLEEKIKDSYFPIVKMFLHRKDILSQINEVGIYLYQNIGEVRGRMKAGNIHLFGVPQMSDQEFLSVMIHEFAHYFDIYSFERTRFGDKSQTFYDISWKTVKVMKKEEVSESFVSGYAMTNQYEDFAESYLYYILHNRAFLEKAQNSTSLARKYDFLQKNIFTKNQFYKKSFSEDETIKSYYWDITKLGVDVKKFLQYLQKNL